MNIFKIKSAIVLLVFLLIIFKLNAQYKSFKLNDKRDTINILDKNNLKQGKWVNRVEELRGEPGFEEEGIYVNNKKEGIWRLYNLTSDLIGVENYKLGGKDGIQQYFTYLGDLYKEESWRAFNPNASYDTIAIYGTGSNEIINHKIVKAEQYSVKHGLWKFYEPSTGKLIKSEMYDKGYLIKPNDTTVPKKTVDAKAKKIEKTTEMQQWDKKNKGKKKVLRDGATGT